MNQRFIFIWVLETNNIADLFEDMPISNNNKLITNDELIPFGYEDDSFMDNEECLELLSVRYDIRLILI